MDLRKIKPLRNDEKYSNLREGKVTLEEIKKAFFEMIDEDLRARNEEE